MTDRLYYTDAYCRAFDATVRDVDATRTRVVLDRTAFFPTSGGQPHDLGTLAGVPVTDVVDEDERVLHVLASPLPEGARTVAGALDWARRFDLMQQHSGQHLLSAVLEDGWGCRTVSVHMGAERNTLDLEGGVPVTDAMLAEAERRANTIITENRPVTVTFEDAATAAGLRKASARTGTLRIVTIADCDRNACGGTHVAHTGEIGALRVGATERTRGTTRVEFRCGQRAIARARHDAALLEVMARECTAGADELPALVRALRAQAATDAKTIAALRETLAGHEARALYAALVPDANGRRVHRVHRAEGAVRDDQALAQALAALGGSVMLVTSDAPPALLLAASEDTGLDCGRLVREVLGRVGGRGGGSPRLAQGSAPSVEARGDAVAALPIW